MIDPRKKEGLLFSIQEERRLQSLEAGMQWAGLERAGLRGPQCPPDLKRGDGRSWPDGVSTMATESC